jgi:uncharacterized membrane protein
MNLFFYFPVLILAGVITGLLIGIAVKAVLPAIQKSM